MAVDTIGEKIEEKGRGGREREREKGSGGREKDRRGEGGE